MALCSNFNCLKPTFLNGALLVSIEALRILTGDRVLKDLKLAIVLGTRPEIIKMCPIIRECARLGLNYFILHTGQHYSYDMDRVFFDQFQLLQPKYNLNIGSGTHAEETSRALVGTETVLRKEKPTITLVEGDTNTVLAGAIASAKLKICVGHVEAGLRSYDKEMPEEINRVLADHVSDYLFAPTNRAAENLLREGIRSDKIYVTGNTIVDSLTQNISMASNNNEPFGDSGKGYFLLTLHRQENVDVKERLKAILQGLNLVHRELGFPIVYPIHPRTRKRLNEFGLSAGDGLTLIEPTGYFSFLGLERKARLILTDSGGVQEEACILKVPCVTLRYNTERPETIDVGANILCGTKPKEILEKVKTMLNAKTDWENPFGDGNAARKIVSIIMRMLDS